MLAKLRIWSASVRRSPPVGSAFITAAAGILLVSLIPLEDLSYDITTWLKPSTTVTDAVVVYVDQETLKLGMDQGKLDRIFYARLLDTITQSKPKLVFMDVIFDQPASLPAKDQMFASAIQNQGSVILVAGSEDQDKAGSRLMTTFFPPIAPIADAAKGWGNADVRGHIVRQISGSSAYMNYAGWVAATNLAPELQMMDENSERWLNYYGDPDSGAIQSCLLQDALSKNIPVGFFSNKIVFVGQIFPYGGVGNLRDTFDTPYSRFGSPPSAGVLIHATALLNLVHEDWLNRISRPWQWMGSVVWAFLCVGLFHALSSRSKGLRLLAGACAIVGICAVSFWLQWNVHWWWGWVGPAFAQTPLALLLVKSKQKPYIAFISYRRKEDAPLALLIRKSLADHGLKAFIDVQSLHAGKFNEQLLVEIESAAFFILILSADSLARCTNKDDWVLRELTHALAKQKTIIPIIKDGFAFDASDIPKLPQIAELKNYQSVRYSDSDFDGFLSKLKKLLLNRK